ncbi:metal-dependent hydrolase [Rummeliibacillus sp. TYF005]|uniref:metal-dependent hydrolase n=1 Tax=Rummeliibacillus sp. TYF005 TaxID=2058214 RepID=UPI000F53A6D9|nr:metal-dependent hydrolase [Rummeliibacillus sp. TYF005]RPJ94477.1 metal-dependent hydrolase [Rummeliibacillus sp. TYF005]
MTGNTHILGGIASSLAFAQITHYDPIILVGASVFGALLPDICHTGSKIGRTFPIISKIVNTLFGHRSITHSLLFLILIILLMTRYISNDSIIAGILIGMVSHYILDMFTKKGIMLLFPLNIMVRFPITTRTGSKTENVVAFLLSLLCLYLGFETIKHSI